MNANGLRAMLAGLFAATALGACDREPGDRTLGQKLDSAVSRTESQLAEAGRKTKEELTVAGEKTKAALSDAGQKAQSGSMSDAAITASIKTDYLKDPDLSVLKIDVDTKGGVVTLNGLAADEAARARAEKLAGAVKGVREVKNYLVIKRA